VIRFSASLVVVGLGLLVAGGITSKLLLIYISIAVCAVALLFLIIGAIVNRAELLGREPDGIASGQTEANGYTSERDEVPEPAASAVGAGASASRGYPREHAEGAAYADGPGYGRAVTPPDRPREAPFDRGKQPATRDFADYEKFAGDAERRRPDDRPSDRPDDQRRGQSAPPRPARRPAEPDRPFADPEPTRMDLNAADIQAKGRQERERSEPARPDRDRADRDRADRQPADKPFVDPNSTRMDWTTADLRDAGQQDRARPSQDRPERDRPERDRADRQRADRGRRDQPFADPEPTRMDLNAAEIREAGRQEREAGRPERETTRTSQPAPSPAEPTQPTPTQPAPAQPAHARPDKLLVSRGDRKTPADRPGEPERPAGPAGSLPPSGEPRADRPADNDAGDAQRPAEQAAAPSAAGPAADPAAGSGTSEGGDGRPAEAAATREQPTLASPDRDQATGSGEDDKDSKDNTQGDAGSGSGSSLPDQDQDQDQDLVTVVPGVPRYHRSDCILIRFMGENDLQRMPVERARESGCTPCRACQPDGDEDE
jgi:hypothetical protein